MQRKVYMSKNKYLIWRKVWNYQYKCTGNKIADMQLIGIGTNHLHIANNCEKLWIPIVSNTEYSRFPYKACCCNYNNYTVPVFFNGVIIKHYFFFYIILQLLWNVKLVRNEYSGFNDIKTFPVLKSSPT